MVNSIYDYRIRSKIHFEDMPRIDWEFVGNKPAESELKYEGEG